MGRYIRHAALVRAFAALSIGGTAVISPVAAVAQPAEMVTVKLFKPDEAHLIPGSFKAFVNAVREAKAPGECPLGRITVYAKASADPIFAEALGAARRAELLAFLDREGIKVSRFSADFEITRDPQQDGRAKLEHIRDEKPPRLAIRSVPPKGSKVKAGEKIKVTIFARDDADRWQTGIKTIQLVADSEGGRFVESKNYEPCADPPEKRVEATYTVPANPPPIVRLTALAEDHANLMDTAVGEFPTGDWYGTIEFSETLANGRHWGRYDIAFDYDGKGSLKGRMEGDRHWDRQTTPSRLSANLIGQHTLGSSTMSLQIVDAKQTAGTFLGSHPWGGGLAWVEPLQRHLRNLTVTNDGSIRTTIEIWGERWKLTLRRAQH